MIKERLDELAPSLFLSGPGGRSWAVFGVDLPGAGYPITSSTDKIEVNGVTPQYRYLLGRDLGQGARRVGFVMLNPSTASHEVDDPTIRKCMGFARRWDASELLVANCYAYRATDPKALRHAADPVGALNEKALVSLARHCDFIVCSWGRHARERGVFTGKLLAEAGADLRCLALNRDGSPKHPLYCAYDSPAGYATNGSPTGPLKFDPHAKVLV